MKRLVNIAVAAAVFATSALANAAVITLPMVQTVTPATPFLVTTTNPFTFAFDFTNPSHGYLAGSDTVSNAWLSVLLYDEGGSETYKFLLDSTTFLTDTNTPRSELYDRLSITGAPLASLSADGRLTLTISASAGSFKVVSSTLDAQVIRTLPDPVEVPEPLSSALFGLGLVGIGALRRAMRAN